MTTITEIQSAVIHLSQAELVDFREWFDEFEAEQWDEQIEEDVHAGKLDEIADRAVREFQEGS